MCGRYLFTAQGEELEQVVRMARRRDPQAEFRLGEVFPTQSALILTAAGDKVVPCVSLWGFPNGRDRKGVLINARSETAEEKPTFRRSLEIGRCVIPSNGFYEWSHDQVHQKYLFLLPGESALYMAGLMKEVDGQRRFVILTSPPNASMEGIHNRMPLVLPRSQVGNWIRGIDTSTLLHGVPPMLEKEMVEATRAD